MTPFELVASKLEGMKSSGSSGRQWVACCPAHGDTDPSLTVSLNDEDAVILHCFTGCTPAEVAAAMGLDLRDLFPKKEGRRKAPRKTKPATPSADIDEASERGDPPKPPKAEAKPRDPNAPTWATIASGYADKLATHPSLAQHRAKLAERLGIPGLDAVPLLGVRNFETTQGMYRYAEFTIPETDAGGQIVGISIREEGTSHGERVTNKYFDVVEGLDGHRGLILPAEFDAFTGRVYIVEGMTDYAAMRAAGVQAIARPGTSAGKAMQMLSDLFRRCDKLEPVFVGENDEKENGQWPGRDATVKAAEELAARLGRSVFWAMTPKPAKDSRAWLAGCAAELDWPTRGRELIGLLDAEAIDATVEPDGDRRRPRVYITTRQGEVNDEVAYHLKNDPQMYQRGGNLVRVIDPTTSLFEWHPAKIHGVGEAILRDRTSRFMDFVLRTEEGDVAKDPPRWCVQAILEFKKWDGVRVLENVIRNPVLLPDGSILSSDGYHPQSGLFGSFDPRLKIDVPANPTQADAAAAARVLLDLVGDVPFLEPAHRSVWLAALLSPFARYAYSGPTPFFIFDSNTPGSGKGLCCELILHVAYGRTDSQPTGWKQDPEAFSKLITTIAKEGREAVFFDNLRGRIGHGIADAMFTSDSWHDRLLGGNDSYSGPLKTIFFATANNVTLIGDTGRRALIGRIESPDEKPEHRTNVKMERHKLKEHALAKRSVFASAALTILVAWHRAGRPTHNLRRLGTFEAWSGIVREAIAFAGQPDPLDARRDHESTPHDDEVSVMGGLLPLLIEQFPDGATFTAKQGMDRINSVIEIDDDFRERFAHFCTAYEGKKATSIIFGQKIGKYRGRNFGGLCIVRSAGSNGGLNRNGSVLWQILRGSAGVCGGQGFDQPPQSNTCAANDLRNMRGSAGVERSPSHMEGENMHGDTRAPAYRNGAEVTPATPAENDELSAKGYF